MDRYVVIGNPVGHSKSPLIHSSFAHQTGQRIQYDTLLAELDAFEKTTESFFAEGGKGANVTVPFKLDAFALAEQLSPEAKTAGAVNTLYLDEKHNLCGHNTDGIGLVADILSNHCGTLTGKKILLLGAGGASRGILHPLLNQNPAWICIANRTASKAVALADDFKTLTNTHEQAVEISGCGFNAVGTDGFDWIINATSASLQGDLPPIPAALVKADTWCYDLMYSNALTPFCKWAQECGAEKTMDGLGMLVEQAAESFQLWRGVRPKTKEVIALLRKS